MRTKNDSMSDRTDMLPRHEDRNILPSSPFFTTLLRHAQALPTTPAIRDLRTGHSKTYIDLLSDALSLRETIRAHLPASVLGSLASDASNSETYICILAPGGYEYAVAMLATLALGAACVPLSIHVPVQEARYFIQKSGAQLLLVGSSMKDLGASLESLIRSEDRNGSLYIDKHAQTIFQALPVAPAIAHQLLSVEDILISTNRVLDDNKPGVVIFTSGTTGPPKGAVMRRNFVHETAAAGADHFGVQRGDVMLHMLPVHHATGVGINFFPFLIAGGCLEFRSGPFDEEWLWERWREGAGQEEKRIAFFSGVPTMYMRMMRYFERVLKKRKDVGEYIEGARHMRALMCGTSALPRPVDQFWFQLLERKIVQRYGATEFGAIFKVRMGARYVPDGSVGERLIGVDVRLSEGEEGEVLVKSPHMFSKYLNDPEATLRAHTSDGYFRSGDIARKEGKFYFISGRASVDILKSGGYKISALDIEREILALPYIAEVAVLGVTDAEFGQRVAAAVVLRDEELGNSFHETHGDETFPLRLEVLRKDLRLQLAGYKLPTLLRVVHGELPKSATGKISKKTLGPQLFPDDFNRIPEVQIWKPMPREKANL